ncbi:hypothetical protein NPIL_327381 [Nephila pilipes]|uniref:Uncharacterized protein n=1 Tax=Nephila pilipes TaxID=299642 RepID=A0A8X6KJB8_NEPPI|nr:hypothetical protein NPIL_327381 [Nephila pilipes]
MFLCVPFQHSFLPFTNVLSDLKVCDFLGTFFYHFHGLIKAFLFGSGLFPPYHPPAPPIGPNRDCYNGGLFCLRRLGLRKNPINHCRFRGLACICSTTCKSGLAGALSK